MRVLALLFAMFFCGASAAELKIASFNVQNLFDGVNDGTEYADFEIGRGSWSEQKYERKLQAVVDKISALNADILGLQEIENEAVLKALAQKVGYKFYAFSRAQTAPAGVAVMSRIPIKFQKTYRLTELKTRDILRADFALGG
ncbi:MAG: endonuclease/exonuclease/phosphatase family protein, partial [Campylobacter sp.]|nr:endonuclease/exonuclease/phosphatase family protein [Campylobacter sp.]